MASRQDIFCRTESEIQVLEGPTALQPDGSVSGEASSLTFSPQADCFAVTAATGITIYDSTTLKERVALPVLGTLAASFSRQGTFLVTQNRPAKGVENDKNLRVWRVADGELLLGLHQKNFSREEWPAVQFGTEDKFAFHRVTNNIHAYDCATFKGVAYKVNIPGVGSFAPCPVDRQGTKVAAYCPEAKGKPASAGVYTADPASNGVMICRKSFFRSNSAQLLWSPKGGAVLALAVSDVDATNQSYYGEQKLYYLAADGKKDCAVEMPKAGPIHDVQWSPRGDFFIVVSGFMPAKAILFSQSCTPKFDLGSGPYSMVRWNLFGRYFVLAGYGNLPGDMAFYEAKKTGNCHHLATTRAENGVALEWSPDGQKVLVSTTVPRLRVDNGIKIIRADGCLLGQKAYPVLMQAAWRPTAPGTFTDTALDLPPAEAKASGAAAPAPAPPAVTGYVPPHLRNNPAAAAAARSKFSLARDADDRGGKIVSGVTKVPQAAPAARPVPPGLPPSEAKHKSAAKNAKRRAAAAAKKQAQEELEKMTI